jgi:hypothetical protein
VSIAGGHWYTSSGFWTPASGVIAVVIIGAMSVWVTVRLAYPKTVMVRNAGRRDITREAFDGTPLELDLDQDIVECLDVETKPDDQPMPQVSKKGSVVAIEPVKIGGGETISINLLTDGEPPVLRKPRHTLTDVKLWPQPTGERPTKWGVILTFVVPLMLMILATIVTFDSRDPGHWGIVIACCGLSVGSFRVGMHCAAVNSRP